MKINRDIFERLHDDSEMKDLVQRFKELHPRRLQLPFVLHV